MFEDRMNEFLRKTWTRRCLSKTAAAAGLAGLGWQGVRTPGASAAVTDPHFFLQVFLRGGIDNSYFFDARPLAMTQAGRIVNHAGVEPERWDFRGDETWITPHMRPLKPFADRMTVLNGVLMATSFDGHEQNELTLLTGNPFGGESFIPHLNRRAECPLDYVRLGGNSLVSGVTNEADGVPLSQTGGRQLIEKINGRPPLRADGKIESFLRARMSAAAVNGGRFSAAAQKMVAGFDKAPELEGLLRSIDLGANDDEFLGFLETAIELFRGGVTSAVELPISPTVGSVDSHDVTSAAMYHELANDVASQIARLVQHFIDAPFDESRSMLDVTTILVTSEFSRTMRQDKPINECGTDHNPLNNSVLLFGKGVRGGRVLGQSDLRTVDEPASGAHRVLDQREMRIMGRPFDFTTGRASSTPLDVFDESRYLTVHCVVNTLYELLGLSARADFADSLRIIGRDGPQAPSILAFI